MALEGTVSKWVAARGYGFVTGSDGEEVFVHSGAITGGHLLLVGKTVNYDIDTDSKKRGNGPPAAANVSGPGVLSNDTQGVHTGTVKEWFSDKAYGFIKQGNDGVYVHRSAFDGARLEPGKTVSFDLAPDTNHDSGRGIAVNVSGEGVMKKAEHRGLVTKWLYDKNYGFVQEDTTHNDIFVHTNEIGGGCLNPGSELFFDIGDRDGKEFAYNCSGPAISHDNTPSFLEVSHLLAKKGGKGKGSKGSKGGKGKGGKGDYDYDYDYDDYDNYGVGFGRGGGGFRGGKGGGSGYDNGGSHRKGGYNSHSNNNHGSNNNSFGRQPRGGNGGGGAMGGKQEEMRCSPVNGQMYTKKKFADHFGSLREWNAAKHTSTTNPTPGPQRSSGYRNDNSRDYGHSNQGYGSGNQRYNSGGGGGGYGGGKGGSQGGPRNRRYQNDRY